MITFSEIMQELCEEIQRLDGGVWGELPIDEVLEAVQKFTKTRSEWVVTPIRKIEFEGT